MGKRMSFSRKIVECGRFYKLPVQLQALYFHLNMNADDEGVVDAYPIIKIIDCTEDDLKLLEEKGFIKILNEDLITYISDFEENNSERSDRKKKSDYHDLLEEVAEDPEEDSMAAACQTSDNQVTTKCQPSVNQVSDKCQASVRQVPKKRTVKPNDTDYIIVSNSNNNINTNTINKLITNTLLREEVKEVKENEEENIDYQRVADSFNYHWPGRRIRDITDKRKALIRSLLKVYSYEEIDEGFKLASKNPFLAGEVSDNGKPFIMRFNWIAQREVFTEMLEGKFDRAFSAKRQIEESGTDYAAMEQLLIEN
jgi:hypothetical protein